MTYLTREQILSARDIKTEMVDVPQWGGAVLVRGLSGEEREAFEKASMVETPSGNRADRRSGRTSREVAREGLRARLVAWFVVDAEGNNLFTEADVAALNKKSGGALEKVIKVGLRLSGMSDDDVDQLAEEMLENPFDDSSTA